MTTTLTIEGATSPNKRYATQYKMQSDTKKIIRLLSEKYLYSMFFENNILKISNKKNEIEIFQISKNEYKVSYNCMNFKDEITTIENEIFDILINIYRRDSFEKIAKNPLELITIEILKEYEHYSEKEFKEKFDNLTKIDSDYKNIGGNRILQEYYKGYLILIDDFHNYLKSNVVKIK